MIGTITYYLLMAGDVLLLKTFFDDVFDNVLLLVYVVLLVCASGQVTFCEVTFFSLVECEW
jgi:hypothetical protein